MSAHRRDFLKTTGTLAAASAFTHMALKPVHAAGNEEIRIALVGCGGRGTGAAVDALNVQNGQLKLVAMADVFDKRLKGSYTSIKAGNIGDKVDVPEDRRFVGFEAYKQAMDVLRPGDIVILATPPAFRWVHFTYAIDKGLNVFMEKPVTVDGPSSQRMLKLYEKSLAKNLKVGVGLMCRHCVVRKELFDKIQAGEIGDITMLRGYRMSGPVASCFSKKKPDGENETLYQIERFHSFLWASGGAFSDYYIHNIDECCWMKNAWPVKAQASGGRNYREEGYVDQNFDTYNVEYTFADGAKLFMNGRLMKGCKDEFASYAHGTKGMAVISSAGHAPSKARIYKGQKVDKNDLVWSGPKSEPNPYRLEWEDLVKAVRDDTPYNEVKRGVEASVVTAMGASPRTPVRK
ncbi:MAG: Gfo/Idh/MocA family oxidoreductase [Pirellulales bacterium]